MKERESSSDSGFEDGPNSPMKLHAEKPNSPSKIMVTKERRERRNQDRRSTNSVMNFSLPDLKNEYKEDHEKYRYDNLQSFICSCL